MRLYFRKIVNRMWIIRVFKFKVYSIAMEVIYINDRIENSLFTNQKFTFWLNLSFFANKKNWRIKNFLYQTKRTELICLFFLKYSTILENLIFYSNVIFICHVIILCVYCLKNNFSGIWWNHSKVFVLEEAHELFMLNNF